MRAAGDKTKFSEEMRCIPLLVQVLNLSKGLVFVSRVSRIGFLTLGTTDIWGDEFLTERRLFCTSSDVQQQRATLTLGHNMPVAAPTLRRQPNRSLPGEGGGVGNYH